MVRYLNNNNPLNNSNNNIDNDDDGGGGRGMHYLLAVCQLGILKYSVVIIVLIKMYKRIRLPALLTLLLVVICTQAMIF